VWFSPTFDFNAVKLPALDTLFSIRTREH
jgi:hypothetical protein